MIDKNKEFFNNIDSEIKAYLLGFYVGDGSINMPSKNKIRYDFKVLLSEKDIYILELYKKYLAPGVTIKHEESITTIFKGKEFKCQPKVRFQISSKEICLKLESYGYGQNKTFKELHIPKISDELMPHFIRGYFDADGVCIVGLSKEKRIKELRVKPTFCITSKTKTLLEELQNYLFDKLKIDIKLYYEKQKDVYNFKSANYSYLRILYDYLYTNANFYLERKKKSFAMVMLTPREFRELKSSEPRNA